MGQSDLHPLAEFYKTLDQWSKSISGSIVRITEAFDGPRKAIAEFVERNAELFDVLRSLDVAFPLLVEDMLSPLVQHGWYPDLELPFSLLADLVDEFKKDPSAGENAYVRYLSRELDAIESRLRDAAPERTRVFADAFNSHRSGLFYASIPVLLAQAEGIVWEKLNILLYSSKREALRRRASELGENGRGLSEVLMWPLIEPTSLNRCKRERATDFAGMNRHLVLHGEDITYGCERNSLRAVSHLLFVSDVLKSVPDSNAV